MQATPTPFINAIYDREPLQRLVQGRIVLVGEAAHPTTPHALRSTNMAIVDAGSPVSAEHGSNPFKPGDPNLLVPLRAPVFFSSNWPYSSWMTPCLHLRVYASRVPP